MPSSSAGRIKRSEQAAALDNRFPTCRNYWRLGGSPSPPQRPSSNLLLKPHLIVKDNQSEGKNPNSKYYKLRHGPGAVQLSPLNDDIVMNYRVRLPFDPTPFRGVSRFAFWILFLSILIFLLVLITALFRVEDLHGLRKMRPQNSDHLNNTDNQNLDDEGSLGKSLIFKALLKH